MSLTVSGKLGFSIALLVAIVITVSRLLVAI